MKMSGGSISETGSRPRGGASIVALAPKLQMRQGQSLVMTPQLQQAIKLLQLSNIELADYVDAEIERNPLLERGEDRERSDVAPEPEASDANSKSELKLDENAGLNESRDNLDASKEDVYEADSPSEQVASGPSATLDWSSAGGSGSRAVSEEFDLEAVLSEEKSLHAHLEEQLAAAGLGVTEQFIAKRLIDETDDDGYMRTDIAEISHSLGVSDDSVLKILKICQGFDPAGVMGRNLKECLQLQLEELNRFDPAMDALLDNLELVAKRDMKKLMEVCGVDREDLAEMLSELRELNPKPGSVFETERSPAVAPDVFVRELPNGMFAVELNADTLPRVLIDRSYYAEVSRISRSEDEKSFVAECHSSANWLIKSLDQRARTILKVSQEIVRQQDGFFARGVEALRPLNLKTVADAVEMHESTVSRVTSNKYMATPRGVFELKYFFSAAIPATHGGEAHSAEAVRYRIKSLIESERAGAVLSDDQIVERLRAHGVDIARRTVAKYRESLKIPSSVERRRMLAGSM